MAKGREVVLIGFLLEYSFPISALISEKILKKL